MIEPADFLRQYERALSSQDWAVVAPLIHPDACVTFSSGATFQGKAAVQDAFERNFALIEDETYALSDVHWAWTGEEAAVCLYAYDWSGRINGAPASGGGRGTAVLVREHGRWLLLAEHLGPRPAA